MTITKITKMLNDANVYPDTISKSNNIFTCRWVFFYRHGGTAESHVNKILKALPSAHIVDSGEVWKPFRGGASVAKSSHWFVKFTVDA